MVVITTSAVQASARHGALFVPSDDVSGEVSSVLARALDADKLALIVLGANWCHDSRALAARLNEEPLQTLVDRGFVSALIDVGYYERGQSVMQRFGEQIYYATPTVLVVDPRTETIVGHPDRHQWGAAASISMADSLNYFREISEARKTALAGVPEHDEASRAGLDALSQFESIQAVRIARGYEVVGPLLAVLDQSGEKPEAFDQLWRELAALRNGISEDIFAHRQSLLRGESPRYSLSALAEKYPRLSWE